MNIICGKDIIDISRIESVGIYPVTEDFLMCLEREKNGDYISADSVLSPSLITDFKAIFVDFTDNICSRFPEPSITKSDIEGQIKNPKNLGRIEDWEKLGSDELTLLSSFDRDGNASVRWGFKIWNPESPSPMDTIIRAYRTISLSQIILILKALIDLPKPKNVFAGILEGYSYKKIQRYIRPTYDEYIKGKKKIDLRNEAKQYFLEHHANKATLCISLRGEGKARMYLDGSCGFDIFKKEQEIQSYIVEPQKQPQNQ